MKVKELKIGMKVFCNPKFNIDAGFIENDYRSLMTIKEIYEDSCTRGVFHIVVETKEGRKARRTVLKDGHWPYRENLSSVKEPAFLERI